MIPRVRSYPQTPRVGIRAELSDVWEREMPATSQSLISVVSGGTCDTVIVEVSTLTEPLVVHAGLSLTTGEVVWSRSTPSVRCSTLAPARRVLCDGVVVYDADSGAELFTTDAIPAADWLTGELLRHAAGTLELLDADGARRWATPLAETTVTHVAMNDDVVVVRVEDNEAASLLVLDRASGDERFRGMEHERYANFQLGLLPDTLVTQTFGDRDPETGRRLMGDITFTSLDGEPLGVVETTVSDWITVGDEYVVLRRGENDAPQTLAAVRAEAPEEILWETPVGTGSLRSLRTAGDVIVVERFTSINQQTALDLHTGEILWNASDEEWIAHDDALMLGRHAISTVRARPLAKGPLRWVFDARRDAPEEDARRFEVAGDHLVAVADDALLVLVP